MTADSAIAISGGGLRASLYGAGILSALDNRNSSTIGGLWQLASHLSGLSGGSWSESTARVTASDSAPSMLPGTVLYESSAASSRKTELPFSAAVTSVSMNNMPLIWTMVEGINAPPPTDGWNLDMSIVTPGDGLLGITQTTDYLGDIEDDVRGKAQAGFPISL